MIIAAWIFSWIALITAGGALLLIGFKRVRAYQIVRWTKEGFRHALLDCGFRFPQSPQEPGLWRWVACDDDGTCPDCEQRARWGPQPFRFWLDAGLPGTAEAGTLCGPRCRCRLVAHHSDRPVVREKI